MLGTGAAASTAERTTSAYYLVHRGASILFDCGEGVLGLRPGQVLDLSNIDMLCITHDHSDHLTGLASLARRRLRNPKKGPLEIYGSAAVLKKVQKIIEAEGSLNSKRVRYMVTLPGVAIQFPKFKLTPFETEHAAGSMGFRVDTMPENRVLDEAKAQTMGVETEVQREALRKGEEVTLANGNIVNPSEVMTDEEVESMAYTGDTKYCPSVVEAVKGVDLLIHDSTYLFKHKGHAVKNSHATAVEAGKVAQEAGVKSLVMTHISRHYTKRADLDLFAVEATQNYTGPVALAFDGQRVSITETIRMQKMAAELEEAASLSVKAPSLAL